MNDNLSHESGKQYSDIESACGNMVDYIPLDVGGLRLIHFEEGDSVPVIVVAETTPIWPTGYGFKYFWNGKWFEYIEKAVTMPMDYCVTE